MKYLENLALNYSVELLFEENPLYENKHLLTSIKKYFNNVEILFDTNNLCSFVLNDYTSKTEDLEIPVQIIVIRENSPIKISKLLNSITQTSDNTYIENEIVNCNYSIVISDFMATEIKYNERIYLFNKFLKGLLEVIPCKAIHWSYSQKIVNPNDFQAAVTESDFYTLFGIINVRYFKFNESLILDTIGLSALGLPDIQCNFNSLDKGLVATILYDLANKIFINGDYIKDNTELSIMNINFKCSHQFSLTNPKRVIVNLEYIK